MSIRGVESGQLLISPPLQEVADSLVRRAQRQGFVVPRDIREELKQAGESPSLWKDVLAQARQALSYRRGRYYYVPPVSARVRQEQDQQAVIHRAVRQLIRKYRTAASRVERREEDRIDFIQPVKVRTDDGRELTLLSRDLSTSGMRLVGTRSLLGQKVCVLIPRTEGIGPWCFVVRILWTCAISDELFENGGTFLEASPGEV